MRTRIKICGITNAADLHAAVDAGVDAIGFNLFHGSERYVDRILAEELVRRVPSFVSTVGLFVNPEAGYVKDVCAHVPFDLLQFHGDESNDFCAGFERPFMKVLRVDTETDIAALAQMYPSSNSIMLDTKVVGAFGGTGCRFDWSLVPELDKKIVLAGGLDPNNVAEAIRIVRPYAVDVSSGVEMVKGKKDHGKIEAFVRAVIRADEEKR